MKGKSFARCASYRMPERGDGRCSSPMIYATSLRTTRRSSYISPSTLRIRSAVVSLRRNLNRKRRIRRRYVHREAASLPREKRNDALNFIVRARLLITLRTLIYVISTCSRRTTTIRHTYSPGKKELICRTMCRDDSRPRERRARELLRRRRQNEAAVVEDQNNDNIFAIKMSRVNIISVTRLRSTNDTAGARNLRRRYGTAFIGQDDARLPVMI